MPLLRSSRSTAVVDPGTLLDASVCEYLASIIGGGALVSLYRTRDGGAFGCSVTLDGEQEKEYFRTVEEFTDWLREVDQAVTELLGAAPSVKRPRKAR